MQNISGSRPWLRGARFVFEFLFLMGTKMICLRSTKCLPRSEAVREGQSRVFAGRLEWEKTAATHSSSLP